MCKLPMALMFSTAIFCSASAYDAFATDISVVQFNSASAPASKLQKRQADAKGIDLKPQPGPLTTGKLSIPDGDGPFPAIVMITDCRGIMPFEDNWAQRFNDWGYVTLEVDTIGTRNRADECKDMIMTGLSQATAMEAFGALAFLESLPKVSPARIGAVGWANGATLSLASRDGARQLSDHGFRGVVAFYPDCTQISTAAFVDPVLILSAGADDWTKPEVCGQLASQDEHVEIFEFPEALRGFDDPSMGERTVMADIQNNFKNPAFGVTFGYNADAHDVAAAKVRDYLAAHLH